MLAHLPTGGVLFWAVVVLLVLFIAFVMRRI